MVPTLYATTKAVAPEDQAIGAAIFQATAEVGRTIGLAIATAIEIAVTRRRSLMDTLGARIVLLDGYTGSPTGSALQLQSCLSSLLLLHSAIRRSWSLNDWSSALRDRIKALKCALKMLKINKFPCANIALA